MKIYRHVSSFGFFVSLVLPLFRSFHAQQAIDVQLTYIQLQAVHFVGATGSLYPRDFKVLLAGVEEDNPGIKVMHRRSQK